MAVRTTEDGRIAYAGQHDRVLGTAAQLLLEDGNQQAAALLLDVHSLDFVVVQVDEWNETTEARIDVDHYLIERFTDDVRLDILEALREANRGQGRIEELVVRRALPEAYDWRERVEAALAGTPTNNAVLAPVQSPHPQADGMLFRDPAEMALYRSLKRAQESAEPGDELLIVPNPAIRLKGRSREVDFLVIHRGRCAAIEVDGASHRGKWSSDRSKDQAFERSGVAFVWRIDAADASDPQEADTLVRQFLVRLADR